MKMRGSVGNGTTNGDPSTVYEWLFYCPGCQDLHQIRVQRRPNDNTGPIWSFNGDHERPTFTPSLKVSYTPDDSRAGQVCHSVITNGVIQYQTDCTHKLAGQSVPMPEWPY